MSQVPGMMSRKELESAVKSGEIHTVLTVIPDLYGRLVGKRITGHFFLEEVAGHGMHMCDYLLACDMEMDPVPGYRFTSWESGYGDFLCEVDFSTLRRASWLEGTAIVICDVVDARDKAPVRVAPRSILKSQIERARSAGFVPLGASELEFFAFRDSFESAGEKNYDGLQTYGSYIEDYHILQTTKIEPLVGAIRHHLDHSGIPVEFSKGEWGAGQQEINLRYCDFLEMADRHVVYKNAAKEIAHQQGLSITFMAKWDAAHAGNSQHLHASLWDLTGKTNVFEGDGDVIPDTRARPSKTFMHWLGGLLKHAREMTLFFAPYINSYKRFMPGTFAPTGIGWSYDNRTTGFRVVGDGSSLRTECRIPGADANPYLTFAIMLAAGLDGIENEIDPPEIFNGNLYEAEGVEQIPRTLAEAIHVAEKSEWLRDTLGEDVLEHYLHFARTEKRKFDEVVTTWERARFFERG